jgi:hypothetical protein
MSDVSGGWHGHLYRAIGTDISQVVEILGEEGFEDLWIVGSSFGAPNLINERPDVVISVCGVSADRQSSWFSASNRNLGFTNLDVLFQAGFATGLGIPSLVITPKNFELQLPREVVVATSDPDNTKSVLRQQVGGFMNWVRTERHRRDLHFEGALSPEVADAFVIRLSALGDSDFASREFEELTADLLVSVGGNVQSNPEKDSGVDFVFFFRPASREPIYVELKRGNLNNAILSKSERNLSEAILQRGGGLGVLLYLDSGGSEFVQETTVPLVVRLEMSSLVERLRVVPFERILSDEIAKASGNL